MRRDRHQADDGQTGATGRFQHGRGLGDGAAALLVLVADIDLKETVGPLAALVHRLGQRGD